MRTRAKTPEKKEAAAETAAGTNKLHGIAYRGANALSSLQSEIGTLLLCLQFPVGQPLSQIGWGLFERLLGRYVDLRKSEGVR